VAEGRDFKTNILVFGEKYTMVGRSSPEYMKKLAGYVDEIMTALSERNPTLNKTELAVLAALNTADEFFKQKVEYENLVQMLEPERNRKKDKHRNPPNS